MYADCFVDIQHVVFTANVGKTRRSTDYVATCNGPERIAPGRTEVLNNIPMVVPPIPPSRLDGCGIISIDYALKVGLSLSMFVFSFCLLLYSVLYFCLPA